MRALRPRTKGHLGPPASFRAFGSFRSSWLIPSIHVFAIIITLLTANEMGRPEILPCPRHPVLVPLPAGRLSKDTSRPTESSEAGASVPRRVHSLSPKRILRKWVSGSGIRCQLSPGTLHLNLSTLNPRTCKRRTRSRFHRRPAIRAGAQHRVSLSLGFDISSVAMPVSRSSSNALSRCRWRPRTTLSRRCCPCGRVTPIPRMCF